MSTLIQKNASIESILSGAKDSVKSMGSKALDVVKDIPFDPASAAIGTVAGGVGSLHATKGKDIPAIKRILQALTAAGGTGAVAGVVGGAASDVFKGMQSGPAGKQTASAKVGTGAPKPAAPAEDKGPAVSDMLQTELPPAMAPEMKGRAAQANGPMGFTQ